MDFKDTPEEAAYRQQVRDWLAANAPKKREGEADPPPNQAVAGVPGVLGGQLLPATSGRWCGRLVVGGRFGLLGHGESNSL